MSMLALPHAAASQRRRPLAQAANRPPSVPELNLSSLHHASKDENIPPPLARGATPLHTRHAPGLAAAVSAAAARGLDSALLTSWGVPSTCKGVTHATPVPPPKVSDSAAGRGLDVRRVHLSDTGSTRCSANGVVDLTQAAATPTHDSLLQQLPGSDMNALAELIGHATHRSHTGSSSSGKKQRFQRGRSAGGRTNDSGSARGSSLLPQFTKGFSLYMKRWNPSYYFGPPVDNAEQPLLLNMSSDATPRQLVPASPRNKPLLVTAAQQSAWAAAAAAAKSKIATIEAEHARRRSNAEPALVQVMAAQQARAFLHYFCAFLVSCLQP
jgi:hypothetical protein